MSNIVPCDLQNFVKLLNLENDNSSADEDECMLSAHKNPSSIIINAESTTFPQSNQCISQPYTDIYTKTETSKNIWSEEEVLDEEYDELVAKQEPNYELIYRQNVTPDDLYLQVKIYF